VDIIEKACDHFNDAGVPTALCETITSFLWGKVLYNCSLNALGAILNVPYGRLQETPEVMETMRRIIAEIFLVAGSKGVKLPYENAQAYYKTLTEVQLPPTATHRSSMLQDMAKGGRLTEIDALNGAISRYGREQGIPTPVNDVLTAIIKGFQVSS
jgi:2-dehydropantoate 2-reductase